MFHKKIENFIKVNTFYQIPFYGFLDDVDRRDSYFNKLNQLQWLKMQESDNLNKKIAIEDT